MNRETHMQEAPMCIRMYLLKVSIKIQVSLDLGIWSSVCPIPLVCVCLVSVAELQ